MKRLPSDIMLPKLRMEAQFDPSTVNADERTVELRWYTGAKVRQVSLFEGPYELSFSMEPKSVRMGRINSGTAPLKGGHKPNSDISGVFGVIEKAWLAEDGGHALARFSSREDVEPYFRDVKDRILRNVSMEAQIHELEDVTGKGDRLTHLHAVDWEPLGIALVASGADGDAYALAESETTFPCKVNFSGTPGEAVVVAPQEGKMDKVKVRLLADVEKLGAIGDIVEIDESAYDEKLHFKDVEDKDGFDARKVKLAAEKAALSESSAKAAKRIVDDAIEADKAHAAEIKRLGLHYERDEVFIRSHQNKSTPVDMFRDLCIQKRAEDAPKPTGTVGLSADWDTAASKRERMEDALAARAQRKDVPSPSASYAQYGIVDAALACLSFHGRDRGLNARMDADRIIELSLHTTSDFPLLLGNVMNKVLLPAYQTAEPTFKRIATRKTFNDFRAHHFFRPGDFPAPLLVGEHAEYKYGTLTENRESVTLATYGRIIGFTRQALINDDLGALNDLAVMAARRITAFENKLFYDNVILTAAGLGPNLSDGVAVYNAAHGNIAATGVLSNTTLASAWEKMQLQTSADGLPLGLTPRFLLVSPASWVLARTLLTQITPNVASQVNPFAGLLEVISDPNLTGARFYLLASPDENAQYVWGNLTGQEGPRVQTREGFEIDGSEFKVSIDLGVGALDFRNGVTGAGA